MKAIVVYGSTTGNAEKMAEAIGENFASSDNVEVVVKNVTDTQVNDFNDYDFIFLGSSTWGDGELQDDFIDFEADMSSLDLSGKKAAVFGCGDTGWEMFCEAVIILEKRLKECKAKLTVEGFKVDGDVDAEMDNLKEWANNAVA